MGRYILSAFFLCAVLGGAVWALHNVFAPKWVMQSVVQTMVSIGMTQARPAIETVEPGRITLENITLDSDGFSTVQRLDIRYQPFDFLLNRRVDSVKITAPKLNATIHPFLGLMIDGIEDSARTHPFQHLRHIRKLEIDNVVLDVFSETLGALRFRGDGLSLRAANQEHEIQFSFNTRQKSLRADFDIRGRVNADGHWDIVTTMSGGQIETPDLSLNRITATMNSAGAEPNNVVNTAEITVGGMRLHKTLWQNVNGTFEKRGEHQKLILTSTSARNEGVELSLVYDSDEPKHAQASLYGKNLGHIYDFLTHYDLVQMETPPPPLLQNLPHVTASFDWNLVEPDLNKNLNFNLNNQIQFIDIQGKIDNSIIEYSWGSDLFEPHDFMGGTARIEISDIQNFPITGVLHLNRIDLSTIANRFIEREVEMTGYLSGSLPFTISEDRIILNNANLTANEGGLLKLPEFLLDHVFTKDTDETKAAREVLSNFTFRDLQIEMDGPMHVDTTILLKLLGSNPTLFEGREIEFTLELEKPLAALLDAEWLLDHSGETQSP